MTSRIFRFQRICFSIGWVNSSGFRLQIRLRLFSLLVFALNAGHAQFSQQLSILRVLQFVLVIVNVYDNRYEVVTLFALLRRSLRFTRIVRISGRVQAGRRGDLRVLLLVRLQELGYLPADTSTSARPPPVTQTGGESAFRTCLTYSTPFRDIRIAWPVGWARGPAEWADPTAISGP